MPKKQKKGKKSIVLFRWKAEQLTVLEEAVLTAIENKSRISDDEISDIICLTNQEIGFIIDIINKQLYGVVAGNASGRYLNEEVSRNFPDNIAINIGSDKDILMVHPNSTSVFCHFLDNLEKSGSTKKVVDSKECPAYIKEKYYLESLPVSTYRIKIKDATQHHINLDYPSDETMQKVEDEINEMISQQNLS